MFRKKFHTIERDYLVVDSGQPVMIDDLVELVY